MGSRTEEGRRIGPLILTAGHTWLNAGGVMFAGLTAIPLLGFIGFIQPYLLEEVFGITENLGQLTGNLAAMQEIVVLLLMGIVGAASDNFGRRVIMVFGLGFVALGLLIYPLAQSEFQIFAYRAVFAVGAAAIPVVMEASLQDLPANRSRGLLLGIASIATAVGMAVISPNIGKLPAYLTGLGISPSDAGIYTCWLMVGFALLVALLIRMSWRSGRVAENQPRAPLWENVRKGFSEASRNPRIALACLTSFASRGDLVVVGIFLPLWVVQHSNDAGLTSAEGMQRAGIMFALVFGTSVVWSPIMGFIADRLNRVVCVCLGFSAAGVAYFSMYLAKDPFVSAALFASVAIGIGEIAALLSGGALLGQEASQERRGAVVGVFGLMGAFSILCTSFLGGIVFDKIGRGAPFAMMAIINFLVVLVALLVLIRAPGMSAKEVRTST